MHFTILRMDHCLRRKRAVYYMYYEIKRIQRDNERKGSFVQKGGFMKLRGVAQFG